MSRPSVDFIFVCTGPTCGERGGELLLRAWKDLLVDRGEWPVRRVVPVKCFGECATGPNVCAHPRGEFRTAVDVRQAAAALDGLLERLEPRESSPAPSNRRE